MTNIVFDVGNVLISWDPRAPLRGLLPDDAAIDAFFAEIDFFRWNLEQDRGRSWAEAVAERIALFPHHAALIRRLDEAWGLSITGEIAGTVAILKGLRAAGRPLYAITNFSSEKWRLTQERFAFLREGFFRDVVVSGDEGLVKPDPAIYRLFLARNGLEAGDCLFIDDAPANVAGAQAVGIKAIRFESPERLAMDLAWLDQS